MSVSVKICDILEFVKPDSKVLTKFHCKNISTTGTGCILKNGDLTQLLIKMGDETKTFVWNNVRWKRKIRKIPVLRKRGIYRPSYATFSMKRFFLTSVYIYTPVNTVQATPTIIPILYKTSGISFALRGQ